MKLELTKEELELLTMMLGKAEVDTRIEIHHATRSFEYRDYLKEREKTISAFLEKVKQLKGCCCE